MKVSFDKLRRIQMAINAIPSQGSKGEPINDRLSWAVKRFTDKNVKVFTDFGQGEADLNRDYASVDEKGNFISDEKGGLRFTKENQKKLEVAFKKYIDEGVADVDPYVCKEITRSASLPLWVQVELSDIVVTLDPQIKEFADEENDVNK